ncbi:MAG TPA: uridine kinase [Verrucomicrobia bacterium]|jgi:uridine kinase|nr:uridine kinase [Verrucomicrobiota bacterium]
MSATHPIPIPLAELSEIIRQADRFRPDSGMFLVGIAGGSCSGKTFLCRQLAERLPKTPTVFSLDQYYWGSACALLTNFDEPDALDWALILDHLRAMLEGRTIDQPVYDFTTHRRSGTRPLSPTTTILVEGLYALHPRIRPSLHLAIFVDCPIDTAWQRRRTRDTEERGRSPEDVDRQFREQVLPMYLQHIAPQQAHADLIVANP